MNDIKHNNNIFNSQWVYTCVQAVEKELDHSPTTYKKFHLLTQKLDGMLHVLEKIQKLPTTTVFIQAASQALEQKIVSLYGKVVEAWVKNEVTQIAEQAADIADSLKRGIVVAKAVDRLTERLATFKKEHRPATAELRTILEAEEVMHRAHAFLNGTPCAEIQERPITTDDPLAYEAMEELMDIAYLIYNHDFGEARKRYLQLAEEYKQRFHAHMQTLGATPFDDPLATMQAFIAVANEQVCLHHHYLLPEEIEELFFELSQITAEEAEDHDEPKIFALKLHGTSGG